MMTKSGISVHIIADIRELTTCVQLWKAACASPRARQIVAIDQLWRRMRIAGEFEFKKACQQIPLILGASRNFLAVERMKLIPGTPCFLKQSTKTIPATVIGFTDDYRVAIRTSTGQRLEVGPEFLFQSRH